MPFDLSSKETRLNLSLLFGSLVLGYLSLRVFVAFLHPAPEQSLSSIDEKDAETLRALVTEETPGIYRPVPDPDIGYLLQRDIRKEAFGMLVRTNQAGLRGATLEEKAPGALRVVCLGDSMTFGYKVEESESFPSQTSKDPGRLDFSTHRSDQLRGAKLEHPLRGPFPAVSPRQVAARPGDLADPRQRPRSDLGSRRRGIRHPRFLAPGTDLGGVLLHRPIGPGLQEPV